MGGVRVISHRHPGVSRAPVRSRPILSDGCCASFAVDKLGRAVFLRRRSPGVDWPNLFLTDLYTRGCLKIETALDRQSIGR